MQKEADEHYELLVSLQVADPAFDKMLHQNYERKCKVEKTLNDSKNWQNFVKML